MDSLNTNSTLNWSADTTYTNAVIPSYASGGIVIDSDRISVPYAHINTNDIIGSWNTILTKQECSINTYNEAMEFTKSDEENICIKSSVLEELINHIKELEEINAKNWAELLEEDVKLEKDNGSNRLDILGKQLISTTRQHD